MTILLIAIAVTLFVVIPAILGYVVLAGFLIVWRQDRGHDEYDLDDVTLRYPAPVGRNPDGSLYQLDTGSIPTQYAEMIARHQARKVHAIRPNCEIVDLAPMGRGE